MEIEDFRPLYELYKKEVAQRKESDYAVNDVQMKKLLSAYQFFSEICEKRGGEIEELEIKPTEVNGGITAYFTVFYIDKVEDFSRLSKIVNDMGAISIDSLVDGRVCISFTIPGVFYKK